MLSPVLFLSVQKNCWMNISLCGWRCRISWNQKFITFSLLAEFIAPKKAIPEGNKFLFPSLATQNFLSFLNKLFLFVLIIAAAAAAVALSIQIDRRNMSIAELWHKKRLQVAGFCSISF
jgi:hypothetical protein